MKISDEHIEGNFENKLDKKEIIFHALINYYHVL